MTPKELVLRALAFQNPPRPPLLFCNDQQRSDIVQTGYYAPINFVNPERTLDEWGCLWENAIGAGLGYTVRHPLEHWAAFDSYLFPDPRLPHRFSDIEKAVQKYPDRFVAVGVGLTGFGAMTALRGFENILTDFYLFPDKISQLADRMFAFENAAIEEIGKRRADTESIKPTARCPKKNHHCHCEHFDRLSVNFAKQSPCYEEIASLAENACSQ
jgi:hypothetical protein